MLIESLFTLSLAFMMQTTQFQVENYYQQNVSTQSRQVTVRQLTPTEFQELWYSVHLPNAEVVEEAPSITGNVSADARIRSIAKERGYKLQRSGDSAELQPYIEASFNNLKNSAASEGVYLDIVSGHRSIEIQRILFLRRLNNAIGRGYAYEDIADGVYDNAIDSVLSQTAPPGFSKHQSGYAIDLRDSTSNDSFVAFARTEGFAWLSRNNYYNAKKHGFIPSYPNGVSKQGPEPEAWEYVWVGITNLYER